MESQTKEAQFKLNVLNPDTWIRLLYMIVFGLLSTLARMVIWIIAVLQFLLVLFTGNSNSNMRDLGQGTSKWAYQAFLFLTFNSEDKPFPFSDWPEIEQLQEGETKVVDSSVVDESPETENPDVTPPVVETEPEVSENPDDVPRFVNTGEDSKKPDDKAE